MFQMTPSGIYFHLLPCFFFSHSEFVQDAVDWWTRVLSKGHFLKMIICYNVLFFSTFSVLQDAVNWWTGVLSKGHFLLK